MKNAIGIKTKEQRMLIISICIWVVVMAIVTVLACVGLYPKVGSGITTLFGLFMILVIATPIVLAFYPDSSGSDED